MDAGLELLTQQSMLGEVCKVLERVVEDAGCRELCLDDVSTVEAGEARREDTRCRGGGRVRMQAWTIS